MLSAFASWAEIAVGMSLIAIGAFGFKEAREFEAAEMTSTLSAAHNSEPADKKRRGANRTIMLNGILHG